MYLTQKILKEVQSKPGSVNHIAIFDRSGSMHNLLRQVGDDLIRVSSVLNKGDSISIAYFSGQGQHRFIIKGFQITDDKSIKRVEEVVRANLNSIGLTCFSEVLHDTVKTVEELKTMFPENSMCMEFLTDGQPVPDTTQERNSIFSALAKLKPVIGDSLFVGYGPYYNYQLLSKMATELGGNCVHTDDVSDFGRNTEIIVRTGRSSRKIVIDLSDEKDVVLVFGKSEGRITVYPMEGTKAYVADMEKDLFVITDKPPKKETTKEDDLYAGAYALANQGKIDQALEWLGQLGDKHLVDALNNAFTTDEIGSATQAIHDATFDETKRFIDGKKKNYVPKADAFCLLNALEALTADDEAYFYPTHKEFEYRRIGAKTKPQEGFPKFIKDSTVKTPFVNLSWNKSRLNLSVLAKITGHIMSGALGQVDVFQWKNYTIVKDGTLNVRKIPVSMSEKTFRVLKHGGLVQWNWKWEKDKVYVLDFKRIPIMNRTISQTCNSALVLAEQAVEETKLAAELKVVKYLYDLAVSEKTKITPFSERYSEQQMEILHEIGVKDDGSYSPPMEKAEEIKDHYIARTFELKVTGRSTIPKIDDIIKKNKEGKKLNDLGVIISEKVAEIHGKINGGDIVLLLETEKVELNRKIRELRDKMQRSKFAVLLGKSQFIEFTERKDKQTVVAGGAEVNFVFGSEEVGY